MRRDCSKFSDPRQETPVAKLSVCSRNSEDVGVSGAKLGASSQRLVDESGQLVVDPLLHRKPVQATKNWWDVVAYSSRQKAHRRIWIDCHWCRTAVHYSNPDCRIWTLGLVFWQIPLTVIELLSIWQPFEIKSHSLLSLITHTNTTVHHLHYHYCHLLSPLHCFANNFPQFLPTMDPLPPLTWLISWTRTILLSILLTSFVIVSVTLALYFWCRGVAYY